MTAADGNGVNVSGDVRMEAIGFGGFDAGEFVAGDGTGGFARITTSGTGPSLLTLSSNVTVDASGFGGASQLKSGGTGGTGKSGRARLVANGGGIAVTGDLLLRSISSGGSGDNGGDGFAFIGANPINTATSDARVIAYGGTINVTGVTTLDVSASGGSGADGDRAAMRAAALDLSTRTTTISARSRSPSDGQSSTLRRPVARAVQAAAAIRALPAVTAERGTGGRLIAARRQPETATSTLAMSSCRPRPSAATAATAAMATALPAAMAAPADNATGGAIFAGAEAGIGKRRVATPALPALETWSRLPTQPAATAALAISERRAAMAAPVAAAMAA